MLVVVEGCWFWRFYIRFLGKYDVISSIYLLVVVSYLPYLLPKQHYANPTIVILIFQTRLERGPVYD